MTFEFRENSAYTVRAVCYGKFAYRAHLDNGGMNTYVLTDTDVRFSRFAEILCVLRFWLDRTGVRYFALDRTGVRF